MCRVFHCLLFALNVIIPFCGYSQRDTMHYSIANGLPSNKIYKIAQTPNGMIWLATDAGLVRFDGHTFKNNTAFDGLPEKEIISITADKSNRLIISPFQAGVCYYDSGKIYSSQLDPRLIRFSYKANTNPPFLPAYASRFNGTFIFSRDSLLLYRNNQVQILSSVKETVFYEKPDSAIVVLTAKECVYYKGAKTKHYPLNPEVSNFIINSPYHLCTLYNGNIYLITDSLVSKIRETSEGQFVVVATKQLNGLIMVNSFDFHPDYGWLVAEGHSKMYTIDTALNCKPFKFSSEDINTALVDKDQNLWLGTISNGLYLVTKRTSPKSKTILQGNITCIYEDNTGGVWSGNEKGAIRCFKNNKLIFEQTICNERVRQIIYKVSDQTLLALTDGAIIIGQIGAAGFNRKHLIADAIPKKMCLIDSTVVIATAGGIFYYQGKSLKGPVFPARYTSVCNRGKEIFVGTFNGLYKTRRLSNWENLSQIDPVLKSHIAELSSSVDSIIWIALSQGTIVAWRDKILGEINQATDFRFSYSNIRNLFTGPGRNVWIGTDNGLYRFSWDLNREKLNLKFRQKINLESQANEIFISDSLIYIADNQGLKKIKYTLSEAPASINTAITGFAVSDSSLTLQNTHILNYRQNNISIEFTGIGPAGKGNIIYQYKLEGADNKWSYTIQQNIRYNALRPGNYTFRVAAFNTNNNSVTTPAAISFTILPPFYQRAWFISLCLLLLIVIIVFSTSQWNRYIANKKERKLELQRVMYDLEHKALLAQMNPHFIFNALTSVQAFANQNDIENFNRFLSSFSKLIRQTLEISGHPKIRLRDEISYLESYIVLEKMRFKTFSYNIKYNRAIENMEILPMIIQPFVENAINHGLLMRDSHDGLLEIEFLPTPTHLQVVIEDNGIGRIAAIARRNTLSPTHKSRGMEVTLNRIKAYNEINENTINLQIIDKTNANGLADGTKVILSFPI